MSTLFPSSFSHAEDMEHSLRQLYSPGIHLTKRSTSLSGRSSLRAHEPKTQSFSALCFFAMAYISSRFAAISSSMHMFFIGIAAVSPASQPNAQIIPKPPRPAVSPASQPNAQIIPKPPRPNQARIPLPKAARRGGYAGCGFGLRNIVAALARQRLTLSLYLHHRFAVGDYRVIMRNQNKAIAARLRDEHPVEWITMNVWQLCNIDAMTRANRQLNKAHSLGSQESPSPSEKDA